MDKVRVIERSLRCCAFGWLALIPIFGIPTGVLAILVYKQVRREVGQEWNPARKYLVVGCALAIVGLSCSLLLLQGLLFLIARAWVMS